MIESRYVLQLLVVVCFGSARSATKSGCTLNVLNNVNEKFLPVMFHNRSSQFTLIVPEQGKINLEGGQGITFVCPERNYLVPTNSNSTYAVCVQGTTLKIFRRNYDFNDIVCSKPIKGEIQKTKQKCGNQNGLVINIGYRVTQRYFERLIQVCYDETEGKTLYTQHTIHGEEVACEFIKFGTLEAEGDTSRFKERISFSMEGLAKDVAASEAYKRTYQKKTLSNLLGGSREADYYVNTKSFLARGHLSPDADFLFASSQLTTYFYINTCPQWQIINGGNWVRVESAVRKTADKYQHTFTVVTGTFGVLELPDVNNNPTKIYLVDKKKLPVPKFVWKVLFDENTGEGIAFVSLNNPFVNEINEEDQLCTDICKIYGWNVGSFDSLSKGYIYCCDVNELRGRIATIPSLEVNGILYA